MALTSREDLLAAAAAGRSTTLSFQRRSHNWHYPISMWVARTTGAHTVPGPAGFPAAAAATCDATTPGALAMPTATTGSLHLASMTIVSVALGQLITVLDRAAHYGGISPAVASTKTLNLTTPARLSGTGTAGYVPYLECQNTSGATGQVWTISYTNSAGTSGRTGTLAHRTHNREDAFMPFILQAGDVGVNSVQSITNSIANASGAFSVVIAKPLFTVANNNLVNALRRGPGAIIDLGASPCLMLTCVNLGASTAPIQGVYTIVEG